MNHLQNLYREYNKEYFGDKLPEVSIYFSKIHFNEWGTFDTYDKRPKIKLSPVLINYQRATDEVLLHEMVHVHLWNKYHKSDEGRYLYLWTQHTRVFKVIENNLNHKHFGRNKKSDKYFNLMLQDLTNKKQYDILNTDMHPNLN